MIFAGNGKIVLPVHPERERRYKLYEGNLVICDQEKQYARNLLQMFARNKKTEVQMYLFHTIEELEKFAEQKTIRILLIDRGYPLRQRQNIPAERKFVLVKNMKDSIAENEKGVYRYQSADAIWSQIQNGEQSRQISKKRNVRNQKEGAKENIVKVNKLQNAEEKYMTSAETEKQLLQSVCKTEVRGRLIGIYSPIHRIGKTKFAMELGRELAKKEPVLYLNLEEYAGGDFYFQDQTGQTLADLLYYARQERGNIGLRISTMVGQDEELDYIFPMPYVQDLQGVSAEEWLKLFDQILENCIYGKVIVDLGDSVNGLFQILEKCDTVYTPYIEDGAARAKLNQYAENLRKTGKEKVLEKTIQKKMKGK